MTLKFSYLRLSGSVDQLLEQIDFNNQITQGSTDPAAPIWNGAAPVIGGEPLYTAPNGAPVVAYATYGQGRVIAYGNSRSLDRKTLGYTSMIPNAQQAAMSRFMSGERGLSTPTLDKLADVLNFEIVVRKDR